MKRRLRKYFDGLFRSFDLRLNEGRVAGRGSELQGRLGVVFVWCSADQVVGVGD